VLLFGPPGTGKTMLAKAIAKCSGAWFLNVSLSDIFDKYVGEGEKNVRAIFTLARKLGGPVVIFLDEVDAVFGTRRSDGSGSSRREVMNEFMSEWDGLSSKNDGIVVLGATNRPFDLDDAILRRMPRRILSKIS
jgi:SpoVK/Ycf46/Vps4 family AAA+-type ATPase